MRLRYLILIAVALTACSGEQRHAAGLGQVSKDPASVRGWIADIDTGADPSRFRTVETEAARRSQLFQATNVWIDNAPYVSGGVAENGAFVLLDVPPGKVTISFSAPGVPVANLVLEDVPSNGDVLVPGLILKPGAVGIADPKALQVRISANTPKPARPATVAGVRVVVKQVPVNALMDRHDYLNPPAFGAPVATVK